MKVPYSVDDCRFRTKVRVEGDGELAECRLLRQLTGVADPRLCAVGRDACECCCRGGMAAAEQINPVVGSLLYGLVTRIIEQGGVDGCDPVKASEIKAWAEGFLDTDPSDVDLPYQSERAVVSCHYLGDEAGFRIEGGLERIAVFRCHHPDHEETTHAECDLCRDWTDRPAVDRQPIERWLPIPDPRPGAAVVRTWSVGVTTSPRRRPTLEWTLESLVRAGWDQARLFIDSAVTVPRRFAHFPFTYHEPKLGAWPNFYLALTELLLRDPDADAYMMVQDDVLFHDQCNLREYLEKFLWPSDPPGPVSLYSCQLAARPEFGWFPHEGGWFLGAHAFVFPRAAAEQFLIDPVVIAHRRSQEINGLAHVDTVVGEWAYRNGTPLHFPTPSLCRHIGHTSTLWPMARIEWNRKEGVFVGELDGQATVGRANDSFPESAFPCIDEVAHDYAQRVDRGMARMREQSVVICGLCRDVARVLPRVAARVERLGKMFHTYRAVFYENDSVDGTLAFLEAWSESNPKVHVLTERRGHPRFPQIRSLERAANLALYRNRYRDYVLNQFGDFDMMIVADTDLEGGWSYHGIAHSFSHDRWDFIGSNGLLIQSGRTLHFDRWAFRGPDDKEGRDGELVRRRGEPLLPVGSCFGGLGLYRMKAMKAASYAGGDCEHVVLHRAMRESGFDRLFLNPSQIVLYNDWP